MANKKPSTQSPYLDARREWNERYGDYVSTARFSKVVAYITSMIALVAVAGAIWLAGQKEVKPYIVEVDRNGLIQNVKGIGEVDKKTQARIIKAQLAAFVEKFRSVVLDAQIQRNNVMDIYKYIQKNTPAFNKITEFFQENDPFERAKKETVFAAITRIMPLKDNAWQIEWKETTMDRRTGKTIKNNEFKMIAYITISPPNDEAAIIKNPLGLIINDMNYSKEI